MRLKILFGCGGWSGRISRGIPAIHPLLLLWHERCQIKVAIGWKSRSLELYDTHQPGIIHVQVNMDDLTLKSTPDFFLKSWTMLTKPFKCTLSIKNNTCQHEYVFMFLSIFLHNCFLSSSFTLHTEKYVTSQHYSIICCIKVKCKKLFIYLFCLDFF